MIKDYRIVTNNDILKIIMENKIIRLTLLDREGPGVCSKILKKVYISNMVEGYDTPQFELEADSYEVIDSFYFNDVEIWGVKDTINVGIDEPEYKELCNWYIDRKEG